MRTKHPMAPKLAITLFGIASLAIAVPTHAHAQNSNVSAVRAGKIYTLAGSPIENGVILIRNGKIVAIGPSSSIKIPAGVSVLDARSKVLMPGLVAAYSTLAGNSEFSETVSPDIRAADGFDFFADFKLPLRGGLTTAYIATSRRRLVSGQGAVVKLGGESPTTRTLDASADVRVSLGALPKSAPAIFRPAIPPTTDNPLLPAQKQLASVRPAEFAVLRQLLADARWQMNHPNETVKVVNVGASDASLHMAERALKLKPFQAIISGKRPLRVSADTIADIRLAIRFAKDQKIRIVLEGATEGGKIASEIAANHVPVVASTPITPGSTVTEDMERKSASGKASIDNISSLMRAGVQVALLPPSNVQINDLLMFAAAQSPYGISEDSALKSVTINAAEILGEGSRVGSLMVGKDADFLVLTGAPLSSTTHVDTTIINGRICYDRKSSTSGSGNLTAIKAGKIYTVSGAVIDNGVVLIRDGKIVGINRDGLVPEGAKLIDASRSSIMPGIIDSYSYLGIHADSEQAPLATSTGIGAVSGRTRLANAIRANDTALDEALKSGVTSVLLAPPAGGAVSGTASLIKPIQGQDKLDATNPRIVKEVAAICFNMQGGAPRMGQTWVFEDLLQGAKAYCSRRIQYVRDEAQWEQDRDEAKKKKTEEPQEPAEVTKDEDQEPFTALFRHEIPAFVHANRSDEILNALKVFRDENDLQLTIVGASDGYRVTEEIRKRAANVAIGPEISRQDHDKTVALPVDLAAAGISVLLESSSGSGTQFLRLNAANAVRNGMNPSDALKSITLNPAAALHVQNRLGSIEPGKDADLVILSGDPMELTSRVEKVIVNGKVVFTSHAK